MDMVEKEKIYKVHMWMWNMEQKYPADSAVTEEAWRDICDSCEDLCKELNMEQGHYGRRLMAGFMAVKEGFKRHIIVKTTKETILE